MKRNQRVRMLAHKRHAVGIISFFGLMCVSTSALALPPASTDEIMKQALSYSDFGLSNAKSDLTMILVDSRNRKKVRSVQIFSADHGHASRRAGSISRQVLYLFGKSKLFVRANVHHSPVNWPQQ